ncbi:Protein Tob2 [Thelohanellus kitauei]|uniref:Protein Tob2 n=1 Tax=Thelohanellus kitauei TaxID=669202 RepID=A0A0C2J914_THEKT|nr:Protein Tob2 [Thelohanellus kitauei]
MQGVIDLGCRYVVYLINQKEPESLERMNSFKCELEKAIMVRCLTHWFPEEPLKGSGFRSINLYGKDIDPIVKSICETTDVPIKWINSTFTDNYVIFIDPTGVTVKIENLGMYEIGALPNGEFSRKPTDNYFGRVHQAPPNIPKLPSYVDYSGTSVSPDFSTINRGNYVVCENSNDFNVSLSCASSFHHQKNMAFDDISTKMQPIFVY